MQWRIERSVLIDDDRTRLIVGVRVLRGGSFIYLLLTNLSRIHAPMFVGLWVYNPANTKSKARANPVNTIREIGLVLARL